MKIVWNRLLCCIFYLLISFETVGQETAFQFKHLSTGDGISHSSVIAIEQDMDGFLWFGTRDGLNKYDGAKFTIFRTSSKLEHSISNNDILDIEVDQNGNLWIGTYNGLNFFDTEKEKFTSFFNEQNNASSVSNNTIWSIHCSENEIWVGTSNGLNIYNLKTKKFKAFYNEPNNPHSLSDNLVTELFKDSAGQMWVGTTNGLNKVTYRDSTSINFKRYKKSAHLGGLSDNYIQAIAQDLKGNMWVGTKYGGLNKYVASQDKFMPYQSDIGEETLVHNDVRALEVDQEGHLWIGTYQGLNKIAPDGKLTKIIHNPEDPASLSKNTIKEIFSDNHGSMWIGAYYGGVNMWNKANFNFHNFYQQPNGKGLNYNVVSSIVEAENQLIIATEGGGVNFMDKRNGRFTYLTKDNSQLPSKNIKSLLLVENGQLWISTYNAGICLFDLNQQTFAEFLNLENGLSSNSVYDMADYSEEKLWIGTFGGGLNLLNKTSGEIVHVMTDATDSSSLSDNQVRSLLVDSKKNLWVGTQNGLNFLSRNDIESGKYTFKRYFYNQKSESGHDVLVIYEDSNGDIWSGTKEKGLHLLNNGIFEKIDLFSEYPNTSNTIHSIIEDEAGIFWISSNNGITKYNPKNKEKRLFETSDGLISNEFNNNAVLYSSDGTVYFGGPDGISSFKPRSLQVNKNIPKVVFTDLKIYNKKVEPENDTGVLDKSISRTPEISLNYDQSIFTIEFAIPNYINPEKNRYAYRLIGLEKEWNYTSNNSATYTIQKPGSYLFEVRGANNDGVWNNNASSININVKPAPWRSWWAFISYGIAIAIALIYLLKIIKSRAKYKHELELEHKENEQQKQMHLMKLQFFTNISHEFRTPLTLIIGSMQQIMADYKGSNRIHKQLTAIQKNSNQLLKLINQLMDFRKLENKQTKLSAAEGNIVRFSKEIFLSFKPLAKAGNYSYKFIAQEDDLYAYYDRDKLERVLYNLISNAFKFTPEGGQINIYIESHESDILIKVEDNGVGIPKDSIERIFDRFYQIDNGEKVEGIQKGTGIGLALSKGIMELHKGSINVISSENKGSTFTISLPKGSEHLNEDEIIRNFKGSEDVSEYIQQLEEAPLLKNLDNLDNLINPSSGKKILIVEDNLQIRQFLISVLNGEYKVLEAPNGKQGWKIAFAEVPDLIISDVMMPEMDGIELCQKVKSDLKTSHIPLILLTARTSLIFKFEGLESGADEYINKPFNVKELQLKIKSLLNAVERYKQKFKNENVIAPSEVAISSIDEELLRKAVQIVEENIGNEFFDIAYFCTELGVSRTMLFTKIKAWTNLTPNEFIQSMRMKRAAQLLEQNKLKVSQVGYKVGYTNSKYFSKSFQKHYSLSPTDFAAKFSASSIQEDN